MTTFRGGTFLGGKGQTAMMRDTRLSKGIGAVDRAPLAIVTLPFEAGAGRQGCAKGPEALLATGLAEALSLGPSSVRRMDQLDGPTLPHGARNPVSHPNQAIRALHEVAAAIGTIQQAVVGLEQDICPVFVGGDHAIAAGTIPALALRARQQGRLLYVLWLDAHPDFHNLTTTQSGHLHGVPLAYATGQSGFSGYYPDLMAAIEPSRLCLLGIRSVDDSEASLLAQTRLKPWGMDAIRRHGIARLVSTFLDEVRRNDGFLHVSFDVDWLDPALAPAVGTPVPDGVTLAQARDVMDLLCESALVSSLDLVEYNPELDQEGHTATTVIELVSRLFADRISKAGLKAA